MKSFILSAIALILLNFANDCDCQYTPELNATEVVRHNEHYWLNCTYVLYSGLDTVKLRFFKDNQVFYKFDNTTKEQEITPVSGIERDQVEHSDRNSGNILIHRATNLSEGYYKCSLDVTMYPGCCNETSNESFVRFNSTGDGSDDDDDHDSARNLFSVNYYVCLVLLLLTFVNSP